MPGWRWPTASASEASRKARGMAAQYIPAVVGVGRPARMGRMTARAHACLLLCCMLVLAAGCAGTSSSQPARGASQPRARCLVNPTEGDTRPLLFLFCVESP